jgi:glycosyltransferase involved in cell wall biosynthesis
MISFIIPTRNNLPYLKLAYNSIRKYYPREEIIILDDNSTDGTKDWLWGLEGDISNSEYGDKNLVTSFHGNRQVGHTVLYDEGIEMARNDIFTIFHADMVCGPNYVENLLKHLKPEGVVAATRIEPPLHPAGKEKIVKNFGIYDTDFKQEDFEIFCLMNQTESVNPLSGKTTKGIFAPWAMYKKDFLAIGGHDKLFSPFPYEDSDIFQRFILAGYDIKQSRDAFVYHFTCRGHRWTEQVQKDDLFYQLCCSKNMVHFIRKWGHWIENDENCYPIIHKKYDIGVRIKNCPESLLSNIEPWFSTIYVDCPIDNYINQVQPGTPFNMKKRVKPLDSKASNDIEISVDGSQLTNERLKTLCTLPKMIEDSGEEGIMEFDIFTINIKRLDDKTEQLVNNESDYYLFQTMPLKIEDPYWTDELFQVFDAMNKKLKEKSI